MVFLSNIEFLFFVLSTSLCLLCAIIIYFSENTIHSICSLLLAIFFSAVSLFLLKIEFLGVAYIIVYAGAVVVLFLFVILSTDLRKEDTWTSKKRLREYKVGGLFLYIFLSSFILTLSTSDFENKKQLSTSFYYLNNFLYKTEFLLNDIYIFSKLFYTHFFLFFLVVGVLLSVVMIASIALCMKATKKFF